MRWTERQRAMLREMGVQLWMRETPAVATIERPSQAVRAANPPPATGKFLGAPADWLVVAEAFAAADPQQEQLLDNMLRAIGVSRVTPTREARAVFRAVSAPADADAAAGAEDPALQATIDAVAPRCILALGRAAAAALLGDDAPLGALRGRTHERQGVPVVVTFSLAFLLRHPAEKAKAWADLCLAVRTVAVPAP